MFSDRIVSLPQEAETIYGHIRKQLEIMIPSWRPGWPEVTDLLEKANARIQQVEKASENIDGLISPETLTGWFGGYAHLVRDGFLRAFAGLRRMSAEKPAGPVLGNEGPQKKRNHPGATMLQLAWVAVCLVMMWAPAKFSSLHVVAPALLLIMSVVLWQRHDSSAVDETRI